MGKERIDLAAALDAVYSEVSYMDFYRDIFPEGELEERGVYEEGRYNGIAIMLDPKGKNRRPKKRITVTDDLQAIDDMVASNYFCVMSPISYAGRSRKSANARYMYALAIDLDGIYTLKQWNFFFMQVEDGHNMLAFIWGLPKPTYLVSSGTGIHIYYVFEEPIPMFDNIVKELEKLKRRLTWQAWTQGASSLHDNVQYESLFQGFRVVGTITKIGTRARAFKVGNKVTVEYLNRFVPAEYRAGDFKYTSKLKLSDAKEKYPEWYQRRIVEKQPKGRWTCKKDLYDWWIRRVLDGGEQGHRYWCLMTLATYAKKCGVSREQLQEDAYMLMPILNKRGDAFTKADVDAALQAYTDSYITYPIDTITERTGIKIEKNKRNGRKQTAHLARARAVQDIDYPNHEWAGRPSKEQIVREWRELHPNGRKVECIRDTGLDKKTVYKWWNEVGIKKAEIERIIAYAEKLHEVQIPKDGR